MIYEKIIDTHLHIEEWINDECEFIDCFEEHRRQSGLKSLNICAIPTKMRTACNNMMLAFYKLAHPNTYIHGGLDHIIWPMTENMPKDMDLISQYRDLMDIGFDGIKLIEGKPIVLKGLGNNLNHPALNRLYEEMEKDGVHIVFHINDPITCWDRSKTLQEFIDKGWFYGNGTYLTYEETFSQALKIFESYPNLKVTLAHFFFCADTPERVIELFEKYPNLCVDLTPGCEMYHSFEANPKYFKEFFNKYSTRVLLGTDATFPMATRCHTWCIDVLYRYLATNDSMMAFDDSILTGISIDKDAKENILYKNFENRVGATPKEINKNALRNYIEKYKHLLKEDEKEKIEQLSKKYL